jgi:hypothetical protein
MSVMFSKPLPTYWAGFLNIYYEDTVQASDHNAAIAADR